MHTRMTGKITWPARIPVSNTRHIGHLMQADTVQVKKDASLVTYL